jgi:protein gp37
MKRFGLDFNTVTRAKGFSKPLGWKRPGLVFVNPWSDFFIDTADAWREEAWEVIRRTPHLTYLILTKRPENIKVKRLPRDWPLPNVWIGVTAENQEMADRRIPILLSTPAALRFVSVEPMIGPVDLRRLAAYDDFHIDALDTPDPSCGVGWVICGGESGPGARAIDEGWALSLKHQCAVSRVPFFMKQMSGGMIIPAHLHGREFPGNKGAAHD